MLGETAKATLLLGFSCPPSCCPVAGATMVDANGNFNDINAPTQWMLQSLSGLAAGAAAALIVGFLNHSIDHHKGRGG
jgi:hypothetical protein